MSHETAQKLGRDAQSFLDNPFWTEWPKPSHAGPNDELLARIFVDARVAAPQGAQHE